MVTLAFVELDDRFSLVAIDCDSGVIPTKKLPRADIIHSLNRKIFKNVKIIRGT